MSKVIDFLARQGAEQLGKKKFVVVITGDYEGGQCFYAGCFYVDTQQDRGLRVIRTFADQATPSWLPNRKSINEKWCMLANKSRASSANTPD